MPRRQYTITLDDEEATILRNMMQFRAIENAQFADTTGISEVERQVFLGRRDVAQHVLDALA